MLRWIGEALGIVPRRPSMAEQVADLKLQLEKTMLESQLDWWVGDVVNPYEPLMDDPSFFQALGQGEYVPWNYDNQKRGEAVPVYLTEYGLKVIRDRSRRLAAESEWAINALTNRQNYIVGKGYQYEVIDKGKPADAEKSELAKAAQTVIDEFIARCVWNERERESVWRCDRDGECFHRLFHVGKGRTEIRWIEPEHVRDYQATDRARFGIITDQGDTETVVGYEVVEDPTVSWTPVRVDATEVVHIKLNTDMTAKRGLPTLFAVRKNLERADKLLRNMSTLAQIQATIAMIRKHRTYSASAISAFQQGQADRSFPNNGSQSTQPNRYMKQYQPGTVLDVDGNTDYEFPAAAINASGLTAILDAELRAIAAKLVMPEYMITSNSSNGNFASTLVAGDPAVNNFENLQAFYARRFGDGGYSHGAHCGVLWRVLYYATEYGDLPREALTELELKSERPSPTSRDRNKETQRNQTLNQSAVMSRRTWAAREDLDYDQEQRQIQQEGPPPGQNPAPGQPPGPDTNPGANPAPPGSAGGDESDAFDFGEGVQSLGDDTFQLLGSGLTDAVLLEAGFTGEKKDKRGYRVCYQDGKRVACPKQAKPAKAKPVKPTVDDAHERIKTMMQGGRASTPAETKALADHLATLTTAQLGELKKRLGLKASGKKADLAAKLAERALAKVGGATPPAPPEKKPEAEKPKGGSASTPPPPVDLQQQDAAHPIAKAIRDDAESHAVVSAIHALAHDPEYVAARAAKKEARRLCDDIAARVGKGEYEFGKIGPEQIALMESYKAADAKAIAGKEAVARIDKQARETLLKMLKPKNPPTFAVEEDTEGEKLSDGYVMRHPFKPSAALRKNIDEGIGFIRSVTEGNGLDGKVAMQDAWTGRASFGRHNIKVTSTSGLKRFFGLKDKAKQPTISLGTDDDAHTVVHEFGHYVEETKPGASERANAFLAYRIGNEKAIDLSTIPGGERMKGEMVRKDHFDRYFDGTSAYYVGKDYKGGGTEITSMGVEALFQDPIGFISKDPEYAQFVIGILRM